MMTSTAIFKVSPGLSRYLCITHPRRCHSCVSFYFLKGLYPQLHQKIRSKDIPGVDGIIKNLQDNLRRVILRTAHAVDVLDEAEKAVEYGKHYHDLLHERADVLQTKEVCTAFS